MKTLLTPILILGVLLVSTDVYSQFVNQNQWRRNQGRTAIPQAQTPPKEPEKLTAEQYVDQEMPKLVEVMELDPFEEAVVRSVLVNSVQKRMELQILKLEPQKMKEQLEKITAQQDAELKAGLPEEKYQVYLEMRENPSKTKRKQKKRKKKKSDDS